MLNLNTEMEVYIKLFVVLFFIGILFIVIGLITWKRIVPLCRFRQIAVQNHISASPLK